MGECKLRFDKEDMRELSRLHNKGNKNIPELSENPKSDEIAKFRKEVMRVFLQISEVSENTIPTAVETGALSGSIPETGLTPQQISIITIAALNKNGLLEKEAVGIKMHGLYGTSTSAFIESLADGINALQKNKSLEKPHYIALRQYAKGIITGLFGDQNNQHSADQPVQIGAGSGW